MHFFACQIRQKNRLQENNMNAHIRAVWNNAGQSMPTTTNHQLPHPAHNNDYADFVYSRSWCKRY